MKQPEEIQFSRPSTYNNEFPLSQRSSNHNVLPVRLTGSSSQPPSMVGIRSILQHMACHQPSRIKPHCGDDRAAAQMRAGQLLALWCCTEVERIHGHSRLTSDSRQVLTYISQCRPQEGDGEIGTFYPYLRYRGDYHVTP